MDHHQAPEMNMNANANMNMRTIMMNSNPNAPNNRGQAPCPSIRLSQGGQPTEMARFSESKLIKTHLQVPSVAAAAPAGCISESNRSLLLKNTFGSKKAKKLLPEGFEPNCHTVLVGRSRDCQDHPGNQRLRVIVQAQLKEYNEATDKTGKTAIVSKVFDAVRAGTPVGLFVKFEQGRYYEVGERAARERIGAMFRDNLHSKYKSSARGKLVARRKSSGSSLPPNTVSIDSSISSSNRRSSAPEALPTLPLLPPIQPLPADLFFDASQMDLMEDLSTFQW